MSNTRNTLIAAALLALGASAWAQGTSGALKQPAPPMPATATAMPAAPAAATPAPTDPAASDKMAKKDHDKHASKKTDKKHADKKHVGKKKDHAMKTTTHKPAMKTDDKAAKPAQ